MSTVNEEHHLAPHSHVQMILGEFPVHVLEGRSGPDLEEEFQQLVPSTAETCLIVGVQLSPVRALWQYLARGGILRRGIQAWSDRIEAPFKSAGWRCEEMVAVFPNLRSARFLFPSTDSDSHRFLVNEILFPRRYSLSTKSRMMLNVYCLLMRVFSRPVFLIPSVFIRVRTA